MVNRIGDNQYTNPYVTGNRQSIPSDEKAPAFLLNYDEEGVIWDRGDNSDKDKTEDTSKEKTGNKTKNQARDTYESSVDISNKTTSSEAPSASVTSSLIESFSRIFLGVRDALKKAFDFIWYGDEEKVQDEDTPATKNETRENADEKINENSSHISANKTQTAKNEIYKTEFDRRLERAGRGVEGVPARNTDLLTTYDGRGKIRKISATESTLILKGDKSIKL